MSAPQVVMYVTSWCPYCERARRLLRAKNVAFEEIDVESARAGREEMIARSGGRRTVPQIFIGNTHVGGSQELQSLEAEGRLDALLGR